MRTSAGKPLSPRGRGVGVRGCKLPPSAEYPSSQPAHPSDASGVLRDAPRKGRRAIRS
ncbi:hypothetical protein [Azospirillum doebereinerae]